MNNTNNTANNEASLGIHYIDITPKERATFERVIAFNVTHGLKAHVSNDIADSNIIISSDSAVPQIGSHTNKTLLVITNQADVSLGDVVLTRPLLITRVMKGLETAINLAKETKPEAIETEESDNQQQAPAESVSVEVEAAEVVNTDKSKEEAEEAITKHHALVIDDSAAIRKQLELELRDAGITADFAASGEEALQKAEEGNYDLIFLDIIMPGIDGYETCKRMRETNKYKKTPIIMLSGKTSPLDEVQGVIAGATTYLTKPVKSAMLQETLNRVTKWLNNFSEAEAKKESATALN